MSIKKARGVKPRRPKPSFVKNLLQRLRLNHTCSVGNISRWKVSVQRPKPTPTDFLGQFPKMRGMGRPTSTSKAMQAQGTSID